MLRMNCMRDPGQQRPLVLLLLVRPWSLCMVMACMSIHCLLPYMRVTHQGRCDPITCEIGTTSDSVIVQYLHVPPKEGYKKANDLTEYT